MPANTGGVKQMSNGRPAKEKVNRKALRERYSDFRFSNRSNDACPACGAKPARAGAKYCLVCGKILSEGYRPLDTIRSAQRLQGKSFLVENAETEEIVDLFARNENNVAHTAWACFVYSMVPYLGVLFIPFTLVFGTFGIAVAHRYPELGGRRLAYVCIGMSFIVLAIQILLWWLLYLIPEITIPV